MSLFTDRPNQRKFCLSLLVLVFVVTTGLVACSPAAEQATKPRVYVLVVDAMRADKLPEAETPTIDNLIDSGAYVPRSRAAVSAQTRVNFVSLPTGTYAGKHGIIGAGYMNENWKYRSTDYPKPQQAQEDLPVPTVFEVLDSELGMTTAYLGMKGYELVGGRGADYQTVGEDYLPEKLLENKHKAKVGGSKEKAIKYKLEMNAQLLEELKGVVKKKDPRFLIANFGASDYMGHSLGVGDAYLRAISNADRQIGKFLRFLEEQGVRKQSTIIVTGDHGMTEVENPENVLVEGSYEDPDFPELADKGIEHAVMSRGGLAFSLYIRDDSRVREAYNWLREQKWVRSIYSEHGLRGLDGSLSDLNYYVPRKSGDFFVEISNEYTVSFASQGQHGSLRDSDMLVPLVLAGRNVKSGLKLDRQTRVVDVAPTVLGLFGLEPAKHLEAQGELLDPVFTARKATEN